MANDTLQLKCYLTISSAGAVRVTKSRPAMAFDEISMSLDVRLPKALFLRPQLSANLVIPESAAMPAEISVEVMENVQAAIELATGLRVQLNLVPAVNSEERA